MESFYRQMRKRYELLLDSEGEPEGGKWNYDGENRSGWRGKDTPPARAEPKPSAISRMAGR